MDRLEAAAISVPGVEVRVVQRCTSTNDLLLQERDAARPLLVAAEEQTAGRGRRGRRWQSAPGAGILFSLARRVRRPPRELAALSLVAGVAVTRALRRLGVAQAALKWPNDLVVNGAKLGGILVETRSQAAASHAVIGIGINCRGGEGLELRLRRRVASLDQFVEIRDRNPIIAGIARALLEALDAFERKGLAAVRAVKWGWHDGTAWTSIATVSLIEFAASSDHINPFSITHEDPERIVISNVAGDGAHQLLVNWTSIFDAEPLWLHGEAERCGVRSRYDRPEQLGPDRWAALVAARAVHTGPCLVVNAGTATTIDMLSGDGLFLGGAISPGIDLMRFVLHEHTGRLPIQEGSFRDAPRNTLDAIETGCRHAQAGAVERMHRAMGGNPLCIVSGGAGRPLLDLLPLPSRYIENLVLDGLARIALSERAVAR